MDSPITAMGVEGITSVLVSATKLIIRLPPKSKGVNPAPPSLSPMTDESPVTTMGADGRKSVRISPTKFILRLPKSSTPKQLNPVLPPPPPPSSSIKARISSTTNGNTTNSVKPQKGNGSLITAPTESTPAPIPITAPVLVAVPAKSSRKLDFDEKKAGEKLRMRYQEEAARKQSRKIQILVKAEVPLPPTSSSRQSSGNKRKISSCSSFSAANGNKNQKGCSLIMKKARKEYINCLEVRNLASMAAQERMQLKTISF